MADIGVTSKIQHDHEYDHDDELMVPLFFLARDNLTEGPHSLLADLPA